MMADKNHSLWRSINPDLFIYCYQGEESRAPRTGTPVLMLHGPMTSHRTWDTMSQFLWKQGFENLYALDLEILQMGGSVRNAVEQLHQAIEWIAKQYSPSTRMVMIGHSTGGVLAKRYLIKKSEAASRFSFVFTLGSPHSLTHLSYQVYVPQEEEISETNQGLSPMGSYVRTPKIPKETFLVNIIGTGVGPNFDGTVRGVFLPEAINIALRVGHAELKQSDKVMAEILACLRGERYQLQVYLDSLMMRTPDEDGMVGPFYFEINGMRSPYLGSFQAEAEHQYIFDGDSTPIATLAYEVDQTLVSTVFRLKDVSRTRHVRRRLFAKLLDSLGNSEFVIHEMQDSEGSRITVRVHTRRMPAVLT